MSTIFSRFISQESLDETVPGEVNDVEFAEAAAEAESSRLEAEAVGDEVVRASNAVSQLEEQNDQIEATVEAEGELSPAAAAGYESARRAVAASLGVDPEEGVGEGIVDQPGLESMVMNKGTVALEGVKEIIQTIIKKVKELWLKFIGKVKDFFRWIGRFFDFMDKKYVAAVNALRAMPEDEFQAKLANTKKWWSGLFNLGGKKQASKVAMFVTEGGKLFDFGADGNKVIKDIKRIQQVVTEQSISSFEAVSKNTNYSTGQLLDQLNAKLNSQVLDFAGFRFELKAKKGLIWDSNTIEVENKASKVKDLKITRDELANALSVGSRLIKEVNRLNSESDKDMNNNWEKINAKAESIFKDYKHQKIDTGETTGVDKAKIKTISSLLNDARAANVQVFRLQSMVSKVMLDGLKAYLELANRFTGNRE